MELESEIVIKHHKMKCPQIYFNKVVGKGKKPIQECIVQV